MNKLLLLTWLVLHTYITQAQLVSKSIVVSNSLIVQFENSKGHQLFVNENFEWFKELQVVYAPYHIYKIAVASNDISLNDMLKTVNSLSYVKLVQENKKIFKRDTIPNDAYYGQQWNMKTIGMETAWMGNMSGVTSQGDTLVVAVIDDGFYTNHPDFGNNLWVNHAEIPGDTIDNDGNGYAGDYWGWNTYLNNDSIYDPIEKGRHGMPIMGIIGAHTNNTIGVAGMNWNIKMMVIVGGGDEANAIQSYGYILDQKKRWLNSNGQQGAYVVSVNSSWGIPNEFPSNSPIWCSLYDTMGHYGIVNAIAVSNSSVDVTISGDMPTLCPSPYKITVTSTNQNDMQRHGAFSNKHVDIGAPGRGIFSTESIDQNPSLYSIGDLRNGTSYAAPHVAAAIPLLYANACDSFTTFSKLHPDSAVLWMKFFIMHGVDTLDFLKSTTVSQGRLNVQNAINLLEQWCDGKLNLPPPPPDPDVDTIPLIPAFYSVFPNPTRNFVNVKGDLHQLSEIVVTDMLGKKVLNKIMNEKPNSIQIQLNLPPLSQGIYHMHLFDLSKKQLKVFKISIY